MATDPNAKETNLADIFGSDSDDDNNSDKDSGVKSSSPESGKRVQKKRIASDSDSPAVSDDEQENPPRPAQSPPPTEQSRSTLVAPSSSPAPEGTKEQHIARPSTSSSAAAGTSELALGTDSTSPRQRINLDDSDDDGDTANALGSNKGDTAEARSKTPTSSKEDIRNLFGLDSDEDEEEFDESTVRRVDTPSGYGHRPSFNSSGAFGDRGGVDDLQLPDLRRPSPGSKLFFVRLPNILGAKFECFDRSTYLPGEEEDHKAYIRWRFVRDEQGNIKTGPDGRPLRESNARLVQWSDGSVQLFVGKEVLDVVEQPILRQFLYVNEASKVNGRTETCLEGHGAVEKKFVLKPFSTASAAHQNLTLSVRAKHMKNSKLVVLNKIGNPEVEKEARAKLAEEQLRMQSRKKQEKEFESSRVASRRGLSEQFLEEDIDGEAEFDEEDISKIKGRLGFARGKGRDKALERLRERGEGSSSRGESGETQDRNLSIDDYRADLASSRKSRRRSSEDFDVGDADTGRRGEESETGGSTPRGREVIADDDDEEEEEEEDFPKTKKRRRQILDEDDSE